MDIFKEMGTMVNALDAASLRQKVISNNIANVNTPGYQTKAVAFEEHLRKAMADKEDDLSPASLGLSPDEERLLELGPGGVAGVRPTIHQADGKIDINQQMVDQTKNQLYYEIMSSRVSYYIGSLKYVIENFGR